MLYSSTSSHTATIVHTRLDFETRFLRVDVIVRFPNVEEVVFAVEIANLDVDRGLGELVRDLLLWQLLHAVKSG
jgi:hypothetical protein